MDFALSSVAASGLGIQAIHDLKLGLHHLRDFHGVNTAVLYPEDNNVKIFRWMRFGHFSLCLNFLAMPSAQQPKDFVYFQ